MRALRSAQRLIYLENQFLWSPEIVAVLADKLRHPPRDDFRLVVLLPAKANNGQDSTRGQLSVLADADDHAGRFLAATIRARTGGREDPLYVHAKVGIVDDVWASIGSDNVNRRSWTHDSELSCALLDDQRDEREPRVLDQFGTGARRYARDLRLTLAAEHLDLDPGQAESVVDPGTMFDAFAQSARALQAWYDGGQSGPRPPGRLRRYSLPRLSRRTLLWATPLYRTFYDPDGRPAGLKRRKRY
jgi:phosphatidylserine/phosphatidylglycerophosphate/cardiolipin synthase-like enzyme